MSDVQHACNKLLVEYEFENGFLGGSYQTGFTLTNGVSVSIKQGGKRTIELSSATPISCNELFGIFQTVEKLLMVFDGRFYSLKKFSFSMNEEEMADISEIYISGRLAYYFSKDFCYQIDTKIVSFQDVLSAELYHNWCLLLDDLDIVFQMFLYSLASNGMPVDVNFAFLVELAEPFAELLKEKTCYCQSLTPGERGTTLKKCVDTLIMNFGKDIFAEELSGDYTGFLEMAVGSRVRIMHIKKKQGKHFDGMNCIKYSAKFGLLYRKILLDLLGIEQHKYGSLLTSAIKNVDCWDKHIEVTSVEE